MELIYLGATDSRRGLQEVPIARLLPVLANPRFAQLHSGVPHYEEIVQFGDVRVNFARQEITRLNEVVVLTSLDFKVLKFFMHHPHRVVSRDEILEAVWGYHCYPVTRTIDNRIHRLRQRLEPNPERPIRFRTVYGAGYKFVP